MTVAAPLFLWGAAAVALATVALHLLAWRRPPESPLPTARFVPEAPVRMVSRAVKPADLALLALRVTTVMVVGAALAGLTMASPGRGLGRVVVVDRSRDAATDAIAAAARRELRDGDAVVVFDSAAREVPSSPLDSIVRPASPSVRGSLSAALVAATRVARRLQRGHDSVEIVVISPFVSDEIDAATPAIRRTWPGAVRAVRAGARSADSSAAARPEARGAPGDPVVVALALVGRVWGGGDVRVVRDGAAAPDSAWARQGKALVIWPASEPAPGWAPRSRADTAFAVTMTEGGVGADASSRPATTVVAPFVRAAAPPAGRVVARWQDGEPAATEVTLGAGCVRSVAIDVPAVGDLALTAGFRRFAGRLAAPCEGVSRPAFASDSVLSAVLPARIPPDSALRASTAGAGVPASRLSVWLLAAALVAALAEPLLRRGGDATA